MPADVALGEAPAVAETDSQTQHVTDSIPPPIGPPKPAVRHSRSPAEPERVAQNKLRLDQLLLEAGHFADLPTARGWIMAGKVVVDGAVIATPGSRVAATARIHLRGLPLKYASRGGYKLERALQRFAIDVAGWACLDAGASTGGFTDCLLQHGASLVHAVDVGFGQLKGKLATNPRVRVFERTNISELNRGDFAKPIDFAAVDLSYLSVTRAIPILAPLFSGPWHIVCLIKPLYEGLAQHDLANEPALRDALLNVFTKLSVDGIAPAAVCVSPLLGGQGAVEFLAQFRQDASASCQLAAPELATDQAMTDFLANRPVELEAYLAQ